MSPLITCTAVLLEAEVVPSETVAPVEEGAINTALAEELVAGSWPAARSWVAHPIPADFIGTE